MSHEKNHAAALPDALSALLPGEGSRVETADTYRSGHVCIRFQASPEDAQRLAAILAYAVGARPAGYPTGPEIAAEQAEYEATYPTPDDPRWTTTPAGATWELEVEGKQAGFIEVDLFRRQRAWLRGLYEGSLFTPRDERTTANARGLLALLDVIAEQGGRGQAEATERAQRIARRVKVRESRGWDLIHTGGGCMAWRYGDERGEHLLATNAEHGGEPPTPGRPVMIGLYDGSEDGSSEPLVLRDGESWGDFGGGIAAEWMAILQNEARAEANGHAYEDEAEHACGSCQALVCLNCGDCSNIRCVSNEPNLTKRVADAAREAL